MKIRRLRQGRVPLPHQVKVLRKTSTVRHPALLLQMRLGKTFCLIRWAKGQGLRRILVLGPLNVLEAWERELVFEGETFVRLYDTRGELGLYGVVKDAHRSPGRVWCLLNFERLLSISPRKDRSVRGRPVRGRKVPLLAMMPWDLVVVDEATRLKNPKAQTTQVCCQGFRTAEHRAILTGLVSPESLTDVFCQYVFLHGQFMGRSNFWVWRAEHFEQDYEGKWQPKRGHRTLIKAEVHRLSVVMRRSEAGIKDQFLPTVETVAMSPAQRKVYHEVERNFALRLESGEKVETQWKLVQQHWLRHLAGGFTAAIRADGPDGRKVIVEETALICDSKYRRMLQLLEGDLSGENTVLWFSYRHELAHAVTVLERAGIAHDWIWGGLSPRERAERLGRARLRKRGVFLATIDCARFGGDYSFADAEIYVSNSWSCEARAQSKDRLVHPVKQRPILLVDLVTKGTVDEDVLDAVDRKIFDANWVMTQVEGKILARNQR